MITAVLVDPTTDVETTISFNSMSGDIHVQGLGTACMSHGPVACIDVYEGELRLLVWADINQEAPTHVIDLCGAKETNRHK